MKSSRLPVAVILVLLGAIFTIYYLVNSQAVIASQENNKVLTSIKPIQLIVKAIAGNTIDVELMLPNSVNAHFYQLRPSELKKLANSDGFIWVGPRLELFLTKAVRNSEVDSLVLLPSENHTDHEQNSNHKHSLSGHQHNTDPHIWLDPHLVIELSNKIEDYLVQKYPHQKTDFRKNKTQFQAELQKTIDQYHIHFAKNETRPVFSDHDAFSRLINHFNLTKGNAVTTTPEQKPGIAHLRELENQIKSYGKICFLNESPKESRYLKLLKKNADISIEKIDLMASNINADKKGYINFINETLDKISQCVSL